jgi:hypothetical protein
VAVAASDRARRLLVLVLLLAPAPATAQLDPEPRANLELGVEGPLRGESVLAGYGFFLWNRPHFPEPENYTRLVVAPTFLLSELVRDHWPGPGFAAGLGVNGGLFRYSHDEFRLGRHLEQESFWGHGAELALSLYPRVTLGGLLPLEGQLRLTPAYLAYQRGTDTASRFRLPPDTFLGTGRVGVRLGGVPPELLPDVALELSVWYEGRYRVEAGTYGLPERPERLAHLTHRGWARLGGVATPVAGHTAELWLTGGMAEDTDPLSAFRLGSALPFRSEVPLLLHGYYVEEVFARRFWLVNLSYRFPLWPGARRVQLRVAVDYARVSSVTSAAITSHAAISAGSAGTCRSRLRRGSRSSSATGSARMRRVAGASAATRRTRSSS